MTVPALTFRRHDDGTNPIIHIARQVDDAIVATIWTDLGRMYYRMQDWEAPITARNMAAAQKAILRRWAERFGH